MMVTGNRYQFIQLSYGTLFKESQVTIVAAVLVSIFCDSRVEIG